MTRPIRDIASLWCGVPILLALIICVPLVGAQARPADAASGQLRRIEPTTTISIAESEFLFLYGFAISPDSQSVTLIQMGQPVNLWALVIYWWPEILGLVTALAAVMMFISLHRIWRTAQARNLPYCRRCNYCLQGIASTRCPECGCDLSRNRPMNGRSSSRRLLLPVLPLVIVVLTYLSLWLFRVPRVGTVSGWLLWPTMSLSGQVNGSGRWADSIQESMMDYCSMTSCLDLRNGALRDVHLLTSETNDWISFAPSLNMLFTISGTDRQLHTLDPETRTPILDYAPMDKGLTVDGAADAGGALLLLLGKVGTDDIDGFAENVTNSWYLWNPATNTADFLFDDGGPRFDFWSGPPPPTTKFTQCRLLPDGSPRVLVSEDRIGRGSESPHDPQDAGFAVRTFLESAEHDAPPVASVVHVATHDFSHRIELSPLGNYIVRVNHAGSVEIRDASTGLTICNPWTVSKTIIGHASDLLAVNPDESILFAVDASSAGDQCLIALSLPEGRPLAELDLPPNQNVRSMQFSKDALRLFVLSEDRSLQPIGADWPMRMTIFDLPSLTSPASPRADR